MNYDEIVMDSSSFINFVRYYCQYNITLEKYGKIFPNLINFFKNEINQNKIIILDKVYDELTSKDVKKIKENIKISPIESTYLATDVKVLIDRYYDESGEVKYKKKDGSLNEKAIKFDLDKYITKHADLYLIAYANRQKEQGKKILIITEESMNNDGKLISKIPVICKGINENLFSRSLPYLLFDYYKDRLKFYLELV